MEHLHNDYKNGGLKMQILNLRLSRSNVCGFADCIATFIMTGK